MLTKAQASVPGEWTSVSLLAGTQGERLRTDMIFSKQKQEQRAAEQ